MRVSVGNVQNLLFEVLRREGVDEYSSSAVSKGLTHASLRGVDSHGIRLFRHYLAALNAGRVNGRPKFSFSKSSPSTSTLDADHAFGHAAGMKAVEETIQLAKASGLGAVSVQHSTHFGAASFFGLEIARNDMIGLSFTHSDPLIAPTGGKKAYLGNNPVCFTAPCDGEQPICLDMATSTITFNEVLRLRGEGLSAPFGSGFDRDGRETADPNEIVSLSPVGGYKGYGLSLMVEVLCALLSSAPFGPNIGHMYNDPLDSKRNLGHFFLAINIEKFVKTASFKHRLKQLVTELRQQERVDLDKPVFVAGDPEKVTSEERREKGLPVNSDDKEFFQKLATRHDLPFHVLD